MPAGLLALLPMKTAQALLLACATLAACAIPAEPPHPGPQNAIGEAPAATGPVESAAPLAPWLERVHLVPFVPDLGCMPEIDRERGTGEYSLVYVVAADRSGMTTRFKGAAHPLSIGLRTEAIRRPGGGQLHARFPGTEERVLLAEWTADGRGNVIDAWVRTKPVLELRLAPLPETPTRIEWRLLCERDWRS